jgi:sugar (pentulose or hexulose) kinase
MVVEVERLAREIKERVLAIDAGTQSLRALVFDADGLLIDMAKVVYHTPYHSTYPGWAEQDVAYYFTCLVAACRKLWKQGKVTPESIKAICVTTQRGTIINLDADGRPLRPAILWLDGRQASTTPSPGLWWGSMFKMLHLTETLHHLQREAEANWLWENERAIWEATRHYLFLSGYLLYRLTGEIADSIGSQVGYVPFDYRKQGWAQKGNWKWRALLVKPETLPRLVPVGEIVGQVNQKSATETGLPVGLPVFAGASDKACEVIGAGCLHETEGCIGYGTTATISVNSRQYIEPIRLVPPYPGAVRGAYNLEVQVFRGFWMVSWFKEHFAQIEQQVACERNIAVESLLDELASGISAGSDGLMLQPFWSPGVRYPGPEAKGSIVGFSGIHTKGHVYRAILEGLAYALFAGHERIEKRTGISMKELVVCGGGSKSKVMMQITADMFKLPAYMPVVSETSGLGAAMIACAGLRYYKRIEDAASQMSRRGAVFEPDLKNAELYQKLYHTVYRKMYRRLRPLFQSMRNISNGPQ